MNPVFNEKRLQNIEAAYGDEVMTTSGAVNKTIILTLLCIGSAALTWGMAPAIGGLLMPIAAGGAILGLILVLVTVFSPKTSPVVAPIYAVVEGVFVGAISLVFNAQSNGIVMQAVMLTFGILLGMLGLYRTRIIRVTPGLRAMIVSATLGILLFYVGAMIARAFGMPVAFLHDASWMGIGINLFIIAVAAFNFLLDFDLMERLPEANAPKYYEWYCGLGFLVTLVWLYLQVLRLLSRRN